MRELTEFNADNGGENEKRQSLPTRFWLAVIKTLLIFGLVFYILYHVTNGFAGEIKTVPAAVYTENLGFYATGTVVRNETVIYGGTGAVDYARTDGTKVKINARVATLYPDYESGAAIARLSELCRMRETLEAAGVDKTAKISDGVAVSEGIKSSLAALADITARGKLSDTESEIDTLRLELLKYGILTENSGAVDIISSIESEELRISASLGGGGSIVTTPYAGYFYSNADGFENAFDYGKVSVITPSEYRNALSNQAELPSSVCGKTVTSPYWYFLCPSDIVTAASLKKGASYSLIFDAGDIKINMTLVSKNDENDETLLVFGTREMPKGFDFQRTCRVYIVSSELSGFRIPSRALRVVDGITGVYIQRGSSVLFRACDVLYENSTYAYVSTSTEDKTVVFVSEDGRENVTVYKGLMLYDNVIVSGARELTPGKYIN